MVLIGCSYAGNLVVVFLWTLYVSACRPDVTDRQVWLNMLIPFRLLFFF